MNLRRTVPALVLFAVVLVIAGCAGAGPARMEPGSSYTRCGGSTRDQQRALFFVYCSESP